MIELLKDSELIKYLGRALDNPTFLTMATLALFLLVWALKKVPYVKQKVEADPYLTRVGAFVLAFGPAALTTLAGMSPADSSLAALLTFLGATGLDKVASGKKPDLPLPLLMRLVLVVMCFVLWACTPKEYAQAINASQVLGRVAAPCMKAQLEERLLQCKSDKACEEQAYKDFEPVADALDVIHTIGCVHLPNDPGCKQ
jgi:hypothetical protein